MNTATAEQLGRDAYHSDGPRAVALRGDLERFLSEDGTMNQAAVRAYLRGWDAENLAAPVPE